MDSDHDSASSNDGPVHRRRTQGTRPAPTTSHRMSMKSGNIDHSYHPTKMDEHYSDEDEMEEEEEDEDDEHQRRHHSQSVYRGRGRPSQQQSLLDNSYDDGSDHHDSSRSTGPLREQDRFLPIANIAKIMKKGVPEKGKIAKDAKETIQECVSEFISFITSEASDRCLQEKRKTINGEDILLAMVSLGFDNYVEPLRTFLTKIREASKYDRTITLGGDLSDEIRRQSVSMPSSQPTGLMGQTQVGTKIQVQPQTTSAPLAAAAQSMASKPIATNQANPNGLEPYGHSVRVVTCIRNDQPGENPNYVYTIQPYQ